MTTEKAPAEGCDEQLYPKPIMSTSQLLELDDVLRRYAWALLKKRTNFIRRAFLDEGDYICEVDWNYLSIEHKLSKFSPKEKDGTNIETNWGEVTTGTRWVSLWSCDFDNKADLKQAHTFRGSRDTTTWVDVDLTQGYTIDKEVSVEVNLPPNFSKFRAGRDNCLSLNKVRGQVFKEMLTWEVNSQVEVLPSWRAHAQLLAKEECNSMEFEIRTTLVNTRGIVPIYFKRKSDRRVSFIVELEDFQAAFKSEEDGGVLTPEEKTCVEVLVQKTMNSEGEETTSTFPQIITKGSCVCLSWSDQKVDIKTSPLSVDESTFDGGESTTNNISEKQFTIKEQIKFGLGEEISSSIRSYCIPQQRKDHNFAFSFNAFSLALSVLEFNFVKVLLFYTLYPLVQACVKLAEDLVEILMFRPRLNRRHWFRRKDFRLWLKLKRQSLET